GPSEGEHLAVGVRPAVLGEEQLLGGDDRIMAPLHPPAASARRQAGGARPTGPRARGPTAFPCPVLCPAAVAAPRARTGRRRACPRSRPGGPPPRRGGRRGRGSPDRSR